MKNVFHGLIFFPVFLSHDTLAHILFSYKFYMAVMVWLVKYCEAVVSLHPEVTVILRTQSACALILVSGIQSPCTALDSQDLRTNDEAHS